MILFLITLILYFFSASCAYAYIGPGAGFAFLSSFVILFISVLLILVSIFSWPVRTAILLIKRRKIKRHAKIRRIVIIGFDGLDPDLCQQYMQEGKLANLAKLRQNGSFCPLQTTMPAISPVAWSTFATGVNPGKHNIFDFFTRDVQTYQPVLSSAKIVTAPRTLKIGPLRVPFGTSSTVVAGRKSQSFWSVLGKFKIFSTVLRVPITYPPEKFYGSCLSAMCAPDLLGTLGSFTLFTTQPNDDENRESKGSVVLLAHEGNCFSSRIDGPAIKRNGSDMTLSIPMRGEIDTHRQMVKLWIGKQKQVLRLTPGTYSPWQKLKFSAGFHKPVCGLVRFLVTQVKPHLHIYMSPINIDPEKPVLPISHPFYYAIHLAKLHGPFSTLGLAEDTWALNEGVIDEEAFLKQSYDIYEERQTIFLDHLKRSTEGLTVSVFDTTDRIQHMFFRYLSDDHPANDGQDTTTHKLAVEQAYVRSDELVGRVMQEIDDRDLLMVISDHGFKPFKWGVNLNSWLWREGYLVLEDGKPPGADWFENVNWTKTRAYACGLAGIFINIRGREKFGIVEPSHEKEALQNEIKEKLETLFDEKNDCKPIRRIGLSQHEFNGPYASEAPDLLVGFNIGYRASWNCAKGKVTQDIIEPNRKRWSGDHSFDPPLVPGSFFSNWQLKDQEPKISIMDIAPTVLNLFGLDRPKFQDGKVMHFSPPPSRHGNGVKR